MVVYRIARAPYAHDLTGEGARRYGGRWNHVGVPCLYTSESRALALLEYSVHLDLGAVPKDLVMLTLEVPEDAYMQVRLNRLPERWHTSPAPAEVANLGTMLLNDTNLSVIAVPSALVFQEYNLLLNHRMMPPGWPLVLHREAFDYDTRIKQ